MFRKTIFWAHLVSGVTAGLVVLMMSVTGVLLTYERQMLVAADGSDDVTPPADPAERRPLEALLAAVKEQHPEFAATSIIVRNAPNAAVAVSAGRAGTLLVDPYTGAIREPGAAGLRHFFETVEGWHRWFNATGESRPAARAVTGASNLAFLFLVLSGMYLWLPRMWKWAAFKTRLLFNPKATTGKARDFNWHHVFGIWSAIPLAVVVATAVVFSYPWANNLVYRSVGEEPPVRGAPRGGASAGPASTTAGTPAAPGAAATAGVRAAASGGSERGGTGIAAAPAPYAHPALGFDALLERAAAHAGEWRALTLNIPAEPNAESVRIGIDQGNGGQPQRRHTVTLDAATGNVTAWAPFSSQSTGQKARSWIRFLHTGEALGVLGQTIAGIVSLTSVLMVWTGLALAWRRLIVPLYTRKPDSRGSTADA
jgi:uncharacterized iron-regulated membrane protein